jgi:Phage tail lysozyme
VPIKKILQVDVDDSPFKRFKQIFDQYQSAVAKLPQDWQKIAIAAGGVAEAHSRAGEATEKQTSSIQRQAVALNDAQKSSDSIFQNWRSIASSAREVDRAIERSVVKMAKWGGLAAGVLGGLGVVGSLFGLDKLASSIGSARTRAMGLGVTYGQQAAYDVNYSRLVHPGDIMSNISTAKYDLASDQYKALVTAGVSQKDIASKNPAQIFSEFMHRIPEIFAGVPKDRIGTTASQYGLNNIMSTQDIVAYLGETPEGRAKIEADTQKDAKDMDLQDSVQRQWQDFITQLGRATETVKAKFMDKISVIEPDLEKLSAQISGMVTKFVDGGAAKASINWLGVELDKFAEYVGKKEFQDDVRDFAKWVGSAAKSLWNFVSFFSGVSPANADTLPGAKDQDTGDFQPGDTYDPVTGRRIASADSGGPSSPGLTTKAQNEAGLRLMDYLVNERGWTPEAAAIAAGNAQQESSFNPNGPAGDPSIPGGSHGLFQWNRDRLLALKSYAEKTGRPWSDERVQEEFFANEAERKIPNWKTEHGFENAGEISHAYEGYSDNSTGTRIANAKAFEQRYAEHHHNAPHPFVAPHHPQSVVIRNQSGANVPRSVFSIAQPYASAGAQ